MSSFDFSEEQILNILTSYKNKREKEKERYEKIKNTDDYKNKNRERAKQYYYSNKECVKNKYNENKEMNLAKNSYRYYKKRNNLNKFKEKYPNRYSILSECGYLSE